VKKVYFIDNIFTNLRSNEVNQIPKKLDRGSSVKGNDMSKITLFENCKKTVIKTVNG